MDARVKAIAELNGTLKHPDELDGLFLPSGHPERFDLMLLGEMPSLTDSEGIEAK